MNKKLVIILIITILLLALFFRFYQLESNVRFDWDEEETATVVKNLLVNHKFTLIGMRTSVGGLFMGPLYYYFFIPFFLIFKFNPIASPVAVSLVGVLTTYLIFLVASKLFSQETGCLAGLIYAVSNFVIYYDRRVWQANFMTLLPLLVIFCLIKINEKSKNGYLYLALVLALSLHTHFSAIFLFLDVLFVWFLFSRLRPSVKNLMLIIFACFISLLPLIIFNFRHQNILMSNFVSFFQSSGSVNNELWLRLKRVMIINLENIDKIFTQRRYPNFEPYILIILLLMHFLARRLRLYTKENLEWIKLLFIFIIIPIFCLSCYSKNLSEYYFYTSLPSLIIIISYLVIVYSKKFLIVKILSVSLISVFLLNTVSVNLHRTDRFSLKTKKEVIMFIKLKSRGRPIRLQYDTLPGYNFGYPYLIDYYQVKISNNPKDQLFKIAAPLDAISSKVMTKVFKGEIGVEISKNN